MLPAELFLFDFIVFSGGYVSVDMFFFINDYLITSVLGSRLIDLQPEQDGCCEGDCRQEYLWAPVVSGGDPSPILQATEHGLDPVTWFVATLVIFDELVARLSSWDARRYSHI